MPFPRIRKLPCDIERLIGENAPLPKYTYFNPSSSYPYIYVRATEKTKTTEFNHMFIYNRKDKTMKKIIVPQDALKPSCGLYQGIEDSRLITYQGRIWFISTSTHITESMHSEMLIGRFDQSVSEIEFTQFLDFGMKPLKNMCPFVYQNKLCVIDTYELKIYEIVCEKTDDGKDFYKPVVLKTLRPCKGLPPNTMRGSTSPIHLHGNLWGCIVHEHIRQAREKMISLAYISYWMEFDIEREMVTSFSAPFIVAQWGVEFISGIEYYREKDEIELFLGAQDQVALIAKTNLHQLRTGQ